MVIIFVFKFIIVIKLFLSNPSVQIFGEKIFKYWELAISFLQHDILSTRITLRHLLTH